MTPLYYDWFQNLISRQFKHTGAPAMPSMTFTEPACKNRQQRRIVRTACTHVEINSRADVFLA